MRAPSACTRRRRWRVARRWRSRSGRRDVPTSQRRRAARRVPTPSRTRPTRAGRTRRSAARASSEGASPPAARSAWASRRGASARACWVRRPRSWLERSEHAAELLRQQQALRVEGARRIAEEALRQQDPSRGHGTLVPQSPGERLQQVVVAANRRRGEADGSRAGSRASSVRSTSWRSASRADREVSSLERQRTTADASRLRGLSTISRSATCRTAVSSCLPWSVRKQPAARKNSAASTPACHGRPGSASSASEAAASTAKVNAERFGLGRSSVELTHRR